MARFDSELLEAAALLIARGSRQRGRLPSALIRRSISTTYYALLHSLLEEMSTRIVGVPNDFRRGRRILTRVVTHKGAKAVLDKLRGQTVEASIADFLRPPTGAAGPVLVPVFARDLARAFSDAQAKRHDADYDMNKSISETDAKLLRARVERVIATWRAARTAADRDFKHALCILILLNGQLRTQP